MLKIEKFVTASPEQWKIIIEGMRNPMNSWGKMDSFTCKESDEECPDSCPYNTLELTPPECPLYDDKEAFIIGDNDHALMMNLAKNGPVHAKYRRMISVYVTLTAPLYWWKEFDTYKLGTVANSCSTMHKIQEKEFTLEDFSCEHLINDGSQYMDDIEEFGENLRGYLNSPLDDLEYDISKLNAYRRLYLQTKNKIWWLQMIQRLPTSYNQKRTVMLNYEVLHNIYISRRNHKLDEWHTFCDWIEELPYSELIIGGKE